jgi:uncharacterized cupin superfamily protein
MTIEKFRADTVHLSAPVRVPVPIGNPIPEVRTSVAALNSTARTRGGIWECSPGKFQRQVAQAEFCHFLEGECTFTPEGGETIEIGAGDVVFFPPNSKGVWDIRKPSRKVFIVFDEASAGTATLS